MFIKPFPKILLFIPVISMLACSVFTPGPIPTEAELEKEEQVVYSFFVGGGENPVLILEDTATGVSTSDVRESLDYIKEGLPDLSNETIDSFLERNAQSSRLTPDMDLGVDYSLLGRDELSEITKQPNWNEVLNEKYPGTYGYTVLSRVGFNTSLDQAVIYVGWVGGPLMGSGWYYLMEKKNGEWRIKQEVMVWIS
ncbi:MAG: hypothetical protein JNM02_07310 [Anaerolineales bacterium]|nr:hypothetical protein [Anaerolineales bacterium]